MDVRAFDGRLEGITVEAFLGELGIRSSIVQLWLLLAFYVLIC